MMPDPTPQPPPQPAPLDYSGAPGKRSRKRSMIPVIMSALMFTLLSAWFMHNLFVDRGQALAIDGCFLAFLIPVTALCVVVTVSPFLFTKRSRVRRMERVYTRLQALYSTPPEYAAVDIAGLPRLALRKYRSMTADFARYDFTPLVDIENRAQTRIVPETRVYVRQLRDPAATTLASFYVACPPLKQRMLLRLSRRNALFRSLHLTTYLSDGTYLATTCPNEYETDHDVPPGRILDTVPWVAGIQALVLRHRARVAEHLAAHPDLRPEVISTPEAVVARATSETLAVQERRRARGILLPSDLPRYLASKRPEYVEEQTRALCEFLASRGIAIPPPVPAAVAPIISPAPLVPTPPPSPHTQNPSPSPRPPSA